MKAEELRIGNWYQNNSDDEKLKFQQVTLFLNELGLPLFQKHS
jgi:hypothetical protein